MLETGCWILDAGCRIHDAGCRIHDAGCMMIGWMMDTGCSLLVEFLAPCALCPEPSALDA